MKTTLSVGLLACVMFVSPALAENQGKLPKNAVPFTAEQTTALFSGKTLDFGVAQFYFAPDMSMVGYYHDKKGDAFSDGTWKVSDNHFCDDATWRGKDKSAEPTVVETCYDLFMQKNIIWWKNVKAEPKWLGDIYTGQEKKLKAGDKVSPLVAALKKKYGY